MKGRSLDSWMLLKLPRVKPTFLDLLGNTLVFQGRWSGRGKDVFSDSCPGDPDPDEQQKKDGEHFNRLENPQQNFSGNENENKQL